VRDDLDAAVPKVRDIDGLAEVARAALDLNALLQERGEGGGVEDAVVGRLGGVDDVLVACVSFLPTFKGHGVGIYLPYLLRHLLALLARTLGGGGGSLLHSSS
jgi:hypothetical protein